MATDDIVNKLNRLTQQERKVLRGVCFGLTYKEVGGRLDNMAEGTVKYYMAIVFSKLEIPRELSAHKRKRILEDVFCPVLEAGNLAPAPPEPEEDVQIIDLPADDIRVVEEFQEEPSEFGEESMEQMQFEQPEPTPPRWRGLVGPVIGVVVGALVIAALFRFGIIQIGEGTEAASPDLEATIEVAITLTQIAEGQQPATPVPQAEVQEPAQALPTSAPVAASTPAFPEIILSEDGIPSGGSLEIQVPTGEIHVVTSGPASVAGEFLRGGSTRGSVIVLLPSDQSYTITRLVPTQNWHGAYRATTDQWQIIAEDRATAMHAPDNCTGGAGCTIVDVLVVSGNTVIDKYEDLETATSSQPERARHEERVETGPGNYVVYTVSLGENEALIGNSVDVENRGLNCSVWWAKGPREVIFSVLDGAWDRYSGVVTQDQLDELIQVPYNYLSNQHSYCKFVDVPIIELES